MPLDLVKNPVKMTQGWEWMLCAVAQQVGLLQWTRSLPPHAHRLQARSWAIRSQKASWKKWQCVQFRTSENWIGCQHCGFPLHKGQSTSYHMPGPSWKALQRSAVLHQRVPEDWIRGRCLGGSSRCMTWKDSLRSKQPYPCTSWCKLPSPANRVCWSRRSPKSQSHRLRHQFLQPGSNTIVWFV